MTEAQLDVLARPTAAAIRNAGYDESALRRALVDYFQRGLGAGGEFEELAVALCRGPTCLLMRCCYSEPHYDFIKDLLASLPAIELMGLDRSIDYQNSSDQPEGG